MIMGTFIGDARPGSIGRRISCAALFATSMMFGASAANAEELVHANAVRQADGGSGLAARSDRQQLSLAAVHADSGPTSGGAAEAVGILFLRSDGGDPKELRVDDHQNLVFIARHNGEGRAYRNGREVDLNPLMREGAGQIAVAQFGQRVGAAVPLSGLPAAAQTALSQFAGRGITPHVVFSHMTSRQDTGRVSDKMAAKMLAMEASARPGDQNRTVELVRMAMQMFGIKSDACDDTPDPRCNEPGVREAFAQIKREEAQQHASARF
jgi:hypothetical protein